MARIAFIIGERFLYWNSILLALAAAAAICVFLSLYLSTPGRGAAAAVAVPMALVLSMVLSQMVGPVGIWMSWPIGWVVSAGMSLVFYRRIWQKNQVVSV